MHKWIKKRIIGPGIRSQFYQGTGQARKRVLTKTEYNSGIMSNSSSPLSFSTPDLSVLIPSRNEMFLSQTIQDILSNIEGNTEIIAVLDGYLPDPALPADPRCTVIYNPESVGQRAATNQAAKLSKAKYVMKCDAHCTFDKGFDVKMIAEMHDDWTMVPLMKNLHAFDWVCPNGHRRYQGPSGACLECGEETTRDVVWIAKDSPKSVSYCFDSTPHFQYFGDFAKRPEGQGEITETMSLQGSAWMLTRDKYWNLDVCDENFGSWGSQGIEVAVKTWLSGGQVMCNRKTWYAHMFRTQGGDFGFPYPISGSQQERAKSFARDLFFNNKWPLQKRPLSWLVEKFWPVKGWTEADLAKLKANTFKFSDKILDTKPAESEPVEDHPTKGIIYYTDGELEEKIANPVRDRLLKISADKHIPIVSASLKKIYFGAKSVHFHSLKRGILTLFKQILGALENSTADVIFLCEHDVLYHASHFDFMPPKNDVYYYNTNIWKVRWSDGHALRVDNARQLSGLCGYRDFLIKHYRRRIEIIMQRQADLKAAGKPLKNDGVSQYMGYEPGMHSPPRGVDDYPTAAWQSAYPNLDIRHDSNFTPSRWTKEEFQDQTYTAGWTETQANNIPGWEGVFSQLNPTALTKGIIYYTDNELDAKIAQPVRDQLLKISQEKAIPIVSATLKKMDFGVKNIHFPSLKRSYLAMFSQILAALEHSTAEVIFFAEHDVLYHTSHFDFIPTDPDTFYYNQNVWWLRTSDGHALHYDVNQLSGLVGYRQQLLTHFKERYETVLKEGYSTKMGFEPMTHHRMKWQHVYKIDSFKSAFPNVDIKHGENATGARWDKSQFRNQDLLKNWQEVQVDSISGWSNLMQLLAIPSALNVFGQEVIIYQSPA